MDAPVKTTENEKREQSRLPLKALLAPFGPAGFIAVVLLKICLMVLFSSGYQTELFQPFVQHFISNFDNTWDYFYQTSSHHDQFPYQPLMLYLLAFACLPLKVLGWDNVFLVNFFMKLPTLVADILIFSLLTKLFPTRTRQVFWYYFLSPIILYACYAHSQLDLIPTAILFAAVYFLHKHQWLRCSLMIGLSAATKTHVLAAFPIFAIYVMRNQKLGRTLAFLAGTVLIPLLFIFPYLGSPGFQALVIHNPKQSQIFDAHLDIATMKIYLPVFAELMVCGRFALYNKINTDLLDAFLTVVFSLFVLLIVPAPGWYVWIAPFLSLFMIKYSYKDKRIVFACFALYLCYLNYFLFFHQFDYVDLIFIHTPLSLKIAGAHLNSIAFTFLEAALLANIMICYRIGVKSNSIYKRDQAVVVGIGGDSGTGKSTLLKDIKDLLGDKIVELEGDADHKWARDDEQWQAFTHVDPKANFLHRQAEHILKLKRGGSVLRSDYDHETGNFANARLIHANDFIVLSGLHTFYLPKLRKIIDLKIFMDPESAVKTHWKLIRDVNDRGYSKQQVVDVMNRRKTDVDKFIAPQNEFADITVRYFCTEAFDAGDESAQPRLFLKISLSSSVQLEELVQELSRLDLLLNWDYSDNLSKQDLILSAPVPRELIGKFASDMVPNLEELVSSEISWQEGYRGFVQLIILLALSDLMKEKEELDET